MLRDAPAPDHGGDRADRQGAGAAPSAAAKEHEDRDAADQREITSGRPSLVRPSKTNRASRCSATRPDGRERPGHEACDECAVAEVALEVGERRRGGRR